MPAMFLLLAAAFRLFCSLSNAPRKKIKTTGRHAGPPVVSPHARIRVLASELGDNHRMKRLVSEQAHDSTIRFRRQPLRLKLLIGRASGVPRMEVDTQITEKIFL